MLKDAYEIVEAVDGAGALRILESQKEFDAISAIILDLVMPQMDGGLYGQPRQPEQFPSSTFPQLPDAHISLIRK